MGCPTDKAGQPMIFVAIALRLPSKVEFCEFDILRPIVICDIVLARADMVRHVAAMNRRVGCRHRLSI